MDNPSPAGIKMMLLKWRKKAMGGSFDEVNWRLAAFAENQKHLDEKGDLHRAELHTQGTKIDMHRVELDSHEAELDSQKKELYSHGTKLDSQRAELGSQRIELGLLRAELDSQRAELDSQRTELDLLSAELDSKSAELDLLKADLDSHKADRYSYDHTLIRAGNDYLFANMQLAFLEHICPGNRERLKALRDAHKGKRCFVIGNGPSLTPADLDLLKEKRIFCFASNRIHLIFGQTQWRPDVWSIQDADSLSTFGDDYSCLNGITKVVSALTIIRQNKQIPGATYFPHIVSERLPFWFHKDIMNGVMDYPFITGALINIAAYMGFNEIYLLGVDNTLGATKKNEDGLLYWDISTTDHFSDQYNEGQKDILAWEFLTKNKERVYQDLKEHCKYNGIDIFNATRGGSLEVFDRVDLERVMKA